MTPFTRKFITLIIVIPTIFVGSIYAFAFFGFKYNEFKRFPFLLFNIEQTQNSIHIYSAGVGSGKLIEAIDQNKKKIIFTLTGSNDELVSPYDFPINGLIGYDMCYENKYGQHCFGKTK